MFLFCTFSESADVTPPNTDSDSVRQEGGCFEPPNVGRQCEGEQTPRNPGQRYTFMAATNTCIEFTYSGCGGNGNNYDNVALCQLICIEGTACLKTSTNHTTLIFSSRNHITATLFATPPLTTLNRHFLR